MSKWGGKALAKASELFLSGKSMRREQIPQLAKALEEQHVEAVHRLDVRNKTLYHFDISVPVKTTKVGL